jgi:RsiW-degrading membrane proteinase PrsW (M82 family)
VCGAHLESSIPRAAQRPHAFAANPDEHVLHLSPVSTLFPHLPHRRSAPFRLALLVVAAVLIILGYERLTGPSIAVAALAVPLLYLLYLYEVEVYEDEPEIVIGATVVVGIILGFLWAHFTSNTVTQTVLLNAAPQGAPTGRIILTGVIFPLAAQALMLAGPLIVYATREYDEALDGFTFGAACALGFVLASTLVQLWPELSNGLTSVAPATQNALRVIQRGLLTPFIDASTTGLIAGALWLWRRPQRILAAYGWTTTLWLQILIAAAVQIGLGLVSIYVTSQTWSTLIFFLVAVVLLLWVRVAMHHFLLAEAADAGTEPGPLMPCSHCHYVVPRMAFCPHCGVATRSTPKSGSGTAGRRAGSQPEVAGS